MSATESRAPSDDPSVTTEALTLAEKPAQA
jgi:hypothetical protein